MKILQVITLAQLGGAQSVVIELSNEMTKLGHEVIVCSSENGSMWDMLNDDVICEKNILFKREIDLVNDIKSVIYLKRLINKYQPDIIHLHSSKMGALGRIADLRNSKNRVVYTVHGFDSILLANKKFLIIEKLLKGFAKKIVGVSRYDELKLIKNNILNATTVYNGLKRDKKIINSGQIVDFFRNAKDNGKFIVLNISRICPQKNFNLFKEIAFHYENSDKFHFVWIGNKEEVDCLPKNMTCLGEIKKASLYIDYCDIFMLTSNYEGLPMSIIEALSYGKPIISSDVGGISELLEKGAGYCLDNEVSLFVNKLDLLASNKNLYEICSTKAIETYEELFNVDRMVQNYLKVYEGGIR